MKFFPRPKALLLTIALFFIVLGFVAGTSLLDFRVHNNYYEFHDLSGCIYVGLFVLLEAAIYFATDDYRQWGSMQYFHVASVGLFLLSIIGWICYSTLVGKSYLDFNETILGFLLLLLGLGQILFIVNVAAGFIRGKKVLNRNR